MLSTTPRRPDRVEPLRYSVADGRPQEEPEETLMIDRRAEMAPAQMVDQKVMTLLKHHALPVSCLQTMPAPAPRRHC